MPHRIRGARELENQSNSTDCLGSSRGWRMCPIDGGGGGGGDDDDDDDDGRFRS
jgi:hypothetical protein